MAPMFGLPSLQKLLVLAAIVALVWFGFKLIGRLDRQRKDAAAVGRRDRRGGRADARRGSVEDMVKCRVCGAYVPARGASTCERTDCPY